MPIKSGNDLLLLGQLIDAYRHLNNEEPNVIITYLLAARYDRHMVKGDSFDLKVVSDIINSFNLSAVHILDPHSSVATKLIKNSVAVYNRDLYNAIEGEDLVLIVPDKGAREKAELWKFWIKRITDVVYCDKVRDIEGNGSIAIQVLEAEKCKGRDCVIVDDICDGGGTFLGIMSQLVEPKSVSLCVTHGIFSKGLELLKDFKNIYTTDSICTFEPNNQLKIIKNNESTFAL
jgi:ribose-phosphate pyrophosphokinase